MTPVQLRSVLAELLSDLLGQYALPGAPGGVPAINVGSPPPGVTATGLEAVIRATPEQRGEPLINHEFTLFETLHVRFVQHGSGNIAAAVRRVLRKFPDAVVTEVPENAALGILAQRVIRITF